MSQENIIIKKIMSSSIKIRTHFEMNINDNVSIFKSMIKLDGSLLFNDRNEMN